MANWVLATLVHFGPIKLNGFSRFLINSVHMVEWINLVLAILVDFGSLWLHLVLAIFVSFGKYGLLVNLVHTIHLINVVIAILDNLTLQKKRKYLTEPKTLIKIPISFKNLF